MQKGKLAACAASDPTNALNKVLFPTFGKPTMPQFNFIFKELTNLRPKGLDSDLCGKIHDLLRIIVLSMMNTPRMDNIF